MSRQDISYLESPDDAPPPGGHYSAAVKAGGLIFISGQVPRDLNRKVIGNNITEQTAQVMKNIKCILEKEGLSFYNLTRVNVYLQHLQDAGAFNCEYARWLGSAKPARATVGADLNNVLIEIDAIAFESNHQ